MRFRLPGPRSRILPLLAALGVAVLTLVCAALNPEQAPAGLIGVFAVLVSALIGGPVCGWLSLVVTAAGFWLLGIDSQTIGNSNLVFWCAYVGLDIVLIEVIRRLQKQRRTLVEHDERLRLARRAARIWFWEWQMDKDLLRWSRESRSTSRREEYSQGSLHDYVGQRVHPEDRERLLTSLFRAAANRERFELDYRVLEGAAVRWLSAKGKIFAENGGTVMLGMASDITAQMQAEESQSQFRAVLGSLSEGVCTINPAGEIQYLNPAAETMLGYRSKEVEGKKLHELVHLNCAPQEQSCCLREALQTDRPCHIREETLTTASGAKLLVEYTAAPVMSDGVNLGEVMLFRDISERKRAEKALAASEKLAATGRMAATISHELRNPLDSVMQLLYLLKQSPKLGEDERRSLELAEQELARMSQVAQQTLAMHRQPSAMTPVNLSNLLDGVLLLYGKKLKTQRICVKKRYEWRGEAPGFPAELRQVFTNLIVNAVDAMPSGGTLIIQVRQYREPLSSHRDGVLVALLDTGSGIPKSVRRHIFEPFFTTKGEKGSGVGLWVSNGIVQRHHGAIRVHSDERAGKSYTCFEIFLPLNQAQAPTINPAVQPAADGRQAA